MKEKLAISAVALLLLTLFQGDPLFSPVTTVSSVEIPSGDGVKWLISNTGGTALDAALNPYCDGSAGMTSDDSFDVTGTALDAFDNGATVWVNGSVVSATAGTFQYDSDKRIATVNGGTMSGLPVTMTYYAASGRAALRTVVHIGNPGEASATPTVSFISNVGSDNLTEIPATGSGVTGTSSGDSSFTLADRWLITSNSTEGDTAAVTHVLFGPDSPAVVPSDVSENLSDGVFTCGPGTPPLEGAGEHRGVRADYNLPIAPGDTRALMFFNESSAPACASGCNELASANTNVYNSSDLSADLLAGLNPKDLSEISNWRFSLTNFFASAPGPGTTSVVKLMALDRPGTTATEFASFLAFNEGHKGGASVATGDFDNDAAAEIAVGAGPGGGPHVKVYDLALPTGTVAEKVSFFPYDIGFRGGVQVAFGDVSSAHPGKELIVGAGPGGGPHVKVYRYDSTAPEGVRLIATFFAFDLSFAGGVNLDAGDLVSTSSDEIVVGAGPGGGPHVRVFELTTDADGDGVYSVVEHYFKGCTTCIQSRGFFAYDMGFTGGVSVAVGNVDGAGKSEISTGAGSGGGPHVKVFNVQPGGVIVTQPSFGSFFPFPINFTGGVRVASRDTNNDGRADVITAAGPGGGPNVHIYAISDGGVESKRVDFFPYDIGFKGGVFVSGLRPAG